MRLRETIQTYLYRVVEGERQGLLAAILLLFLRLFSSIYALGVNVKLSLYRMGILEQHKLPCHVISLGNITVGGTGKTPTAQRLARLIHDMGYRVVILNRGYRAAWQGDVGLVSDGQKIYMTAAEAGDEAYLLAKSLPGIPVVIGRERAVSGEYAVKKLNAEVIILDDAYQHWQLARDLDIVLIDALNRFGNNFLLPRGTLREPLTNLNRAHAFLLTKVDQTTDNARDSIRDTLIQYNDKALIVESIHRPRWFIEIESWYKGVRDCGIALDTVRGQTVVAISAIGNPSSFEQTIADIEVNVIDSLRFPDHHHYTMSEMQWAMERAIEKGADALVTTEKDAVKIPAEFIHSHRPLPVYVLGIEVRFLDGYEEFMQLIEKTLK
jgi:tetraacyldisaccharide 4'-kinase